MRNSSVNAVPSHPVSLRHDLQTAFTLSAAFALAAAIAVPWLLPSLPPEARALPLPLPVFCAILAVQMTLIYGLLGQAGLRMARARGLSPAQGFDQFWGSQKAASLKSGAAQSLLFGLACGTMLVLAVSLIQHAFPKTLPATLHPPSFLTALIASIAGSLGEEILFRLFLLSLLLRLLTQRKAAVGFAIGVSALLFALAHAPAFAFLFGGWREAPALGWLWLIALNGMCGVVFAQVFLRHGIECAILAHFSTDLVWHVASQWSGG